MVPTEPIPERVNSRTGEINKEKAAEHKKLGNEAFADHQFGKAIRHFNDAISSDDTDHVFFSNRSLATHRSNTGQTLLQMGSSAWS